MFIIEIRIMMCYHVYITHEIYFYLMNILRVLCVIHIIVT